MNSQTSKQHIAEQRRHFLQYFSIAGVVKERGIFFFKSGKDAGTIEGCGSVEEGGFYTCFYTCFYTYFALYKNNCL